MRFALLILLLSFSLLRADPPVISPNTPWLDDRNLPLQAHGGAILKLADTFYLFGEDRSPDLPKLHRAVACYSSKDLAHWHFESRALDITSPENIGPHFILERPKVFHNPATGKYIMYMHLDGPSPAEPTADYSLARVGVAISDTPQGPYTYLHSFRPLNQESRDIGQFIDDDGIPYLIFESRPTKGFFIASLSPDYLTVDKQIAFLKTPLEGGALVHYNNLYYVLGSHLTGWAPNPNVYATSEHLAGPWSEFKNIAPKETNTYNSQSSFLLKIIGTQTTTVLFLADLWNPKDLPNSRYLWMPLEIHNTTLHLPPPKPFTIDVTTGQITFSE